jgi:Predicted integral membrane protein
MNISRKKLILYLLLCILPLFVSSITLFKLPSNVVTHIGLNGIGDGTGSKYNLLIMPIFTLLFGITSGIIIERFMNFKISWIITSILLFIFNLISFISFYVAIKSINNASEINVGKIMYILLDIFIISIGNYYPKIRRNSFLGIRIKWTLENEIVWNKTHRLVGKMMVIFGVILLPSSLFINYKLNLIFILSGGIIMMISSFIYSYKNYKKLSVERL